MNHTEWKISGVGPFYVSRDGIGCAGQWHVNKFGNAVAFRTVAGARNRAKKLNEEA